MGDSSPHMNLTLQPGGDSARVFPKEKRLFHLMALLLFLLQVA